MSNLSGTYNQRIAQDTGVLVAPIWWLQTNDGPGAPAGPYLWDSGSWGYFPDAGSVPFGQVLIESAEYPPLRVRRLRNVTAGGLTVLQLVAKTSGDMADGFASAIRFSIEDDAEVAQDIATILAERNGADKQGKILFGVTDPDAPVTSVGPGVYAIDTVSSLDYDGVFVVVHKGIPYQQTRHFPPSNDLTTIANTAAETTLLPSWFANYLPTNLFDRVQRTLRVTLRGYMSVTGTPTLNLKVKLGGTTLMTTGAIATAGTIANHLWEMVFEYSCRLTGASGQIMGQGKFEYDNAAHAGQKWGMVMTAAATLDLTAALTPDVTVTWGSASPSNTFTCSNITAELLG